MEGLEDYLKALKLRQMLEIYVEEAKRAAESQLDYTAFLHRLVEAEYLGMIERSVNQRLKRAGFPWLKGIDDFDFTYQPQLNDKLIRQLCTLNYLDDATNVLLIGPPGVGKTHLAVGLGVKACQKRKRVQFYSAQDLIKTLSTAKLLDRLGKELSRLSRLDLLIIDEVGYMTLARESSGLFFQLISRRYERGSIIITTNRPFEDWGNLFADTVLATAILDRLLHHSYVFHITGKSYRLKEYERFASIPSVQSSGG